MSMSHSVADVSAVIKPNLDTPTDVKMPAAWHRHGSDVMWREHERGVVLVI